MDAQYFNEKYPNDPNDSLYKETENNKESMLKDLALIMVKLQLLAPLVKK
jgi:hypothetical protein